MGYGGYGSLGGCCCKEPTEPVECVLCESEEGPFCWKVTISGYDRSDGPLGKVNNVNGVHYLTAGPAEFTGSAPFEFACHWHCRQSIGSNAPPLGSVHLFIANTVAESYAIGVGIAGILMTGNEASYVMLVPFIKSISIPFDCTVPHDIDPSDDEDSATCTIEPVFCLCQYPHTESEICFCSKCAACRQGTDDNITGYRVVVSGLQDTGSTANCPGSELNGTYDFDWPWDTIDDEPADPSEATAFSQDGYSNAGGCFGRPILTSLDCPCGTDLMVSFRILPPSFSLPARVQFSITRGPFYATGIFWQKELDYLDGEFIDCMFDGEELDASHITSLDQCPSGSGTTFADPSGATITITALTA